MTSGLPLQLAIPRVVSAVTAQTIRQGLLFIIGFSACADALRVWPHTRSPLSRLDALLPRVAVVRSGSTREESCGFVPTFDHNGSRLALVSAYAVRSHAASARATLLDSTPPRERWPR